MNARQIEALVAKYADEAARQENLELVDVEYVKEHGNWILRVSIDKPGGVNLTDCEKVSQRLDPILEELDPIPTSYSLEVSSPGLERPLKKLEDYDRFAGHLVRIKTYSAIEGRKRFEGRLRGADSDGRITLETDSGPVSIPYEVISKANLVAEIDF